jgi:peptidoglycan hydrolase-like protein with peptidoglycan-binding domain
MRIAIVGLAALGLALAACGSDTEQRAASGGLAGAGTGALVGGPIGAVAGAAIGGVGGAALDEGVDKKAERGIEQAKGGDAGTSARSDRAGKDEIRRAQQALKAQGLYSDKIDGVRGPKTREALRQFQAREGLQQTARLDSATQQRLAASSATGTTTGHGSAAAGIGASTSNSSGAAADTSGGAASSGTTH